jgi:hypothetical protein
MKLPGFKTDYNEVSHFECGPSYRKFRYPEGAEHSEVSMTTRPVKPLRTALTPYLKRTSYASAKHRQGEISTSPYFFQMTDSE